MKADEPSVVFRVTVKRLHCQGSYSSRTISGNSVTGHGGGIYIFNNAMVEIGNTILNAGERGENIFNNGGTVTSHGYNLSSDNGGGFLTGPGDRINTDVANGDWRPLNMERPPFSLPPPLEVVDERCHHTGGIYSDKRLGLWRTRDVPG